MDHSNRVDVPLVHHVDVSAAAQYLVHQLGCDSWHVACSHEHQLIVQLTKGGVPRYTICYECTPAVEKAIYHGSRAWAMSVIPLRAEDRLSGHAVAEIEAGLAGLR
jgi:hypothetical protein